ncbi:hypothetical protein [Lysinibacillus xylanilyticus]|uniref:hypothetical protein n=1 Tax=Lysinibacillus xylanilyticus TaxID=582475 RepID=UPI00083CA1D0|nr:hypothetical protein [Lysinibacillus xylanilyticus]
MGDVINFPDLENVCIQIERTEAFIQTANELSTFLKALPLNNVDNDKLVELMVKHVKEAETGAFLQGFSMGHEFSEYQGNEGDL